MTDGPGDRSLREIPDHRPESKGTLKTEIEHKGQLKFHREEQESNGEMLWFRSMNKYGNT